MLRSLHLSVSYLILPLHRAIIVRYSLQPARRRAGQTFGPKLDNSTAEKHLADESPLSRSQPRDRAKTNRPTMAYHANIPMSRSSYLLRKLLGLDGSIAARRTLVVARIAGQGECVK